MVDDSPRIAIDDSNGSCNLNKGFTAKRSREGNLSLAVAGCLGKGTLPGHGSSDTTKVHGRQMAMQQGAR